MLLFPRAGDISMKRLKRLPLRWEHDEASASDGTVYRLNAEDVHPGRLHFPEVKYPGDIRFGQLHTTEGDVGPNFQAHKDFEALESAIFKSHCKTVAQAKRWCEIDAYRRHRRQFVGEFAVSVKVAEKYPRPSAEEVRDAIVRTLMNNQIHVHMTLPDTVGDDGIARGHWTGTRVEVRRVDSDMEDEPYIDGGVQS